MLISENATARKARTLPTAKSMPPLIITSVMPHARMPNTEACRRASRWVPDLKKAPSVSETLDWARTLVVLGREEIGAEDAAATLHILLKYQSDIERATKELLGRSKPVA